MGIGYVSIVIVIVIIIMIIIIIRHNAASVRIVAPRINIPTWIASLISD